GLCRSGQYSGSAYLQSAQKIAQGCQTARFDSHSSRCGLCSQRRLRSELRGRQRALACCKIEPMSVPDAVSQMDARAEFELTLKDANGFTEPGFEDLTGCIDGQLTYNR